MASAVDPAPESVNEPPPKEPTALVVAPLKLIEPLLIVARYAEPAITTMPLSIVVTEATPEKFVTPVPPVIDPTVEEPLVARKFRLPPLLTTASSESALLTLTVAPEESVRSLVSAKLPVTFNVPAVTKVVPPFAREPERTSVPTPDLVKLNALTPSVIVPPTVRLPAATPTVLLAVK